MSKNIFECQDFVLERMSGQMEGFYLAGGTALAKFYFQHRESYDLDFFTQEYSTKQVQKISEVIEEKTQMKMKLKDEQLNKRYLGHRQYDLVIAPKKSLKIDFVEDALELIRPVRMLDGISILSMEDIYLRKVFAVTGSYVGEDKIGGQKFLGGRQEARDFYDLYCLSQKIPLSLFSLQHCDSKMREGLVVWFHSFDRTAMKLGLTDIKSKQLIEFAEIDRHFKKEIDALIGEEF